MKYLLPIVLIGLLSSCAIKPKSEWMNILNEEASYQKYNALEKNYIGTIYDKGKKKWSKSKEEYHRYFLELWYTRYQLHSPVNNEIDLQEFVGKKVEIAGKEKEFIYGKRKAKKILIGKIRLVE
ncbi:MAG: hypothetical protein AB1422_12530 [bacterium]